MTREKKKHVIGYTAAVVLLDLIKVKNNMFCEWKTDTLFLIFRLKCLVRPKYIICVEYCNIKTEEEINRCKSVWHLKTAHQYWDSKWLEEKSLFLILKWQNFLKFLFLALCIMNNRVEVSNIYLAVLSRILKA